jgi:hypothetical protein
VGAMDTYPVTSGEPGANEPCIRRHSVTRKLICVAMLTLAPLASIAQGWKVSKSVDSMTDQLNAAKRVIVETVEVT